MREVSVRILRQLGLRLGRGGRERGAVTTLVAVLLGGGVLLGMGALVVDVGQVMAEREELQTGADGAAMAVARACALQQANCGSTGFAQGYASGEAKDGASAVTVLCGSGAGLTTCPAEPTNLTGCIGTPPSGATYVEVRTATLTKTNSTVLPPTFAETLVGYSPARIAACARAAWGTPSSGTTLAITLSVCDWKTMTSNGTVYPTAETVTYLHGESGATTCAANPAGWSSPGGFGYVTDSGSCTAQITVSPSGGTTTGSDPGNSASQACQTALAGYRLKHTVLLVPIYDGYTGTGNNTVYHIAGFSEFVLTGYYLGGSAKATSWLTNQYPCGGNLRCLSGYWVTGLLPASGLTNFGGSNFGATVITLVG